MSGEVLLAILVIGALLVLSVALPRHAPAKWHRDKRMFAASQKLEFSFARDGASLLDEGVGEAPIFALARMRHSRLSNLMRGKAGQLEIAICDYHYWTGKGSGDQIDEEQTVFCFDLKANRLPDFTLRPRTRESVRKLEKLGLNPTAFPAAEKEQVKSEFLRALVERIEGKGIEIPGHPAFSGRYRIQARDTLAANAMFSLKVLEFFERECEPLCSVEKAGDWFIVYRKGVLVRPEEIGAALKEANTIRALFKS